MRANAAGALGCDEHVLAVDACFLQLLHDAHSSMQIQKRMFFLRSAAVQSRRVELPGPGATPKRASHPVA